MIDLKIGMFPVPFYQCSTKLLRGADEPQGSGQTLKWRAWSQKNHRIAVWVLKGGKNTIGTATFSRGKELECHSKQCFI